MKERTKGAEIEVPLSCSSLLSFTFTSLTSGFARQLAPLSLLRNRIPLPLSPSSFASSLLHRLSPSSPSSSFLMASSVIKCLEDDITALNRAMDNEWHRGEMMMGIFISAVGLILGHVRPKGLECHRVWMPILLSSVVAMPFILMFIKRVCRIMKLKAKLGHKKARLRHFKLANPSATEGQATATATTEQQGTATATTEQQGTATATTGQATATTGQGTATATTGQGTATTGQGTATTGQQPDLEQQYKHEEELFESELEGKCIICKFEAIGTLAYLFIFVGVVGLISFGLACGFGKHVK